MRRVSPPKRRLWRSWHRDDADKVTPEQVEATFKRDGGCVLARLEKGGHECRDRWGIPHAPDRYDLLTIEHVKEELQAGKRGKLLVTLCAGANLQPPTKVQRALIREYLAQVG